MEVAILASTATMRCVPRSGIRLGQSLDVVWWQLLTSLGKKGSLVDVQEWMTQQEQQAPPEPHCPRRAQPRDALIAAS
jgi:hypothetical protein